MYYDLIFYYVYHMAGFKTLGHIIVNFERKREKFALGPSVLRFLGAIRSPQGGAEFSKISKLCRSLNSLFTI